MAVLRASRRPEQHDGACDRERRRPGGASPHELHQAHVLVRILFHDLGHRHLEVVLGNMLSSFPECKHAGLSAHGLALGSARAAHLRGDLAEIDSAHEVHLPRVDLQNFQPRVLVRVRELDLPVDATRSEKRLIEDVDAVSGHDHLDVRRGFEAVQLIQQLKHRPLHLGVAALLSFHTRGADGIDLVHEDDGRRVLSSHDEKLANHSAALADVFLHELTAGDADEAALRVVGDRPRKQRLAGARWAVQQHPLRLRDAQSLEDLGMFDRQLDDLLDLLDLLVDSAHHLVGAVGRFLDTHELHEGIDLAWEDLVQDVAVAAEGDPGVRLAILDGDVLVLVDDILALLPDLDQDLLLAHGLDHLAAVRRWLQEHVQLLAEEAHPGVQLVALGL
mmetsp:Transcript_56794/g.164778  ORF Transcript_56794/g.164778 Transcript_56794/m.164778 type:complete len:390 (+) Transcript_56794:14-1183(+)